MAGLNQPSWGFRKIISTVKEMFVCGFLFLNSNGNTEYVETQQTTIYSYGMVNLVIGIYS